MGNSPAIDNGSNPDDLDFDQRGEGFPRTIGSQTDIGAVEVQITLTVAGSGPGQNTVRIFNAATGALLTTLTPYGNFFGGIRTAVADVNGDSILDVITGAGTGGGPHIRAFSGADNFVTMLEDFFAFAPNFTGGVFVAAANFNPLVDDNAEIVVAADAGGGPHVKVFDVSGPGLVEVQSFFAYGNFGGGVRVGTADVNDDGIPDIITGAGPGATPHVKVFDGTIMQVTGMPATLRSFFAYGVGFGGGVFVAGGDVNGDGVDDIITGAGPGGTPHVKAFSGDTLAELASFFAYGTAFGGGVRVGTTLGPDGDGIADIITGAGQGGGPHVKIFSVDTSRPRRKSRASSRLIPALPAGCSSAAEPSFRTETRCSSAAEPSRAMPRRFRRVNWMLWWKRPSSAWQTPGHRRLRSRPCRPWMSA
jgi:hypothetical protein